MNARQVFKDALRQYAAAALNLSRAWDALAFEDAHDWATNSYPETLGDFPEHAEAVSRWSDALKVTP